MGQTYDYDTDEIQRAAAVFGVPFDMLYRGYQAFLRARETVGKPWGGQEVGQEWAKIYLPGVSRVDTSTMGVIRALEYLGISVERYGINSELIEWYNSEIANW